MQVLFSAALIVKQMDNGSWFLVFSCLPPWETTWHCFYPISALAQAKMVGIVNKIYCSSSCWLILVVKIVHINKGEGKLALSNTKHNFLPTSPSFCFVTIQLFRSSSVFSFFLPLSQSISFLYPLNYVLISKSSKQMIRKGEKKLKRTDSETQKKKGRRGWFTS